VAFISLEVVIRFTTTGILSRSALLMKEQTKLQIWSLDQADDIESGLFLFEYLWPHCGHRYLFKFGSNFECVAGKFNTI